MGSNSSSASWKLALLLLLALAALGVWLHERPWAERRDETSRAAQLALRSGRLFQHCAVSARHHHARGRHAWIDDDGPASDIDEQVVPSLLDDRDQDDDGVPGGLAVRIAPREGLRAWFASGGRTEQGLGSSLYLTACRFRC